MKPYQRLIQIQAEKYGDRPVMYDRNKLSDPWTAITWNVMSDAVHAIAKALLELGVKPHDRLAQFSQNKSENLIVDFAAHSIRAAIVPIYPTSSRDQVDFITHDAGTEIIFVGNQKQYDIAVDILKQSKHLKKIIVFEKSVKLDDSIDSIYYDELMNIGIKSLKNKEITQRRDESSEEDMACLLYTSGTTGNPKGVVITHCMINEAIRIHLIRLPHISDTDISLAFLPLTHVFERMWCYFLLYVGATIYINHNPTEIQTTLKEVRPSVMCAVPRFWEKVQIGVKEVLAGYTPIKLALVTWALAIGKKYNIDHLRIGKKPNAWLSFRYKLADKLVYRILKHTMGLENAKILPVAGAKLSDNIALFFRSLGVPLVYGYGLTESTATVACYEDEYEIGTVGTIMPDVEIKIGEDNEILLRGKTILKGYYKNEEANKKAFTPDGWFRTGDTGKIRDKKIILTERLKDLFKTSNGKYIAPQEIETRLGADKYIEQVAVIANERNYVTALIAPSLPALEKYAKEHQIAYKNLDELLLKPEIYKLIEKRIAEHQKGMASFELIKKFTLIKIPFTIETGELTNTLKIKRAVITQKYKKLIDAMYS
ncbi:MAG: long-chain fatty acid--CoA ligase [Bacteroidales bacterium]|nr:long-chain fatty acid--CoA ligase [Bacteroidales bacterium]